MDGIDRRAPTKPSAGHRVGESPRGRVGTQPHHAAAERPRGDRPGGAGGHRPPPGRGSDWYQQHHGGKKPLHGHHHPGHHPAGYRPPHYRPGYGWYHYHHGHYYPAYRSPYWGWWYWHYRPAPVWAWWYPVVLPWHRYYYVYYGPDPWWLGYPVIIYEETVIVAEPETQEEIIEWYEVPADASWEESGAWDDPGATWDTTREEWVVVENGEPVEDPGGDGWEVVEEEEGWYDPETGEVFDQLPEGAVEDELTPESTVPERLDPSRASFDDGLEGRIVELINQERAAQGLQPVENEPRLAAAARQHSQEMNDLEYFSHQSPTEEYGTLSRRLGKAGMKSWGWAGENIAMSTSAKAEDFVQMWMDSPGHRENILRPQFRYTGIGVYGDGERFYATQVFSSAR
ncbi:MAG: CAP domain-containing protein [Deltaproteobacteria bacterium]|nr:CAP domain-containing protein [Deltaproteobacteria bacterium]